MYFSINLNINIQYEEHDLKLTEDDVLLDLHDTNEASLDDCCISFVSNVFFLDLDINCLLDKDLNSIFSLCNDWLASYITFGEPCLNVSFF